jgi:siderophore synthetase component
VLLRDHDTVRIHPAWMERAGMTPPPYRLKPGTPNTLVLADPGSLLGWFQTLGVEVNLAAIADAFARAFPVDPRLLWDEIARAVRRAIAVAELPSRVATVARAVLLECESWPSKLVLGPLLEGGAGEASMPSGTGRIPNPLLGATRRAG